MSANNTTRQFYALWSREQLIDELIRVNKLLDEIEEISRLMRAKV